MLQTAVAIRHVAFEDLGAFEPVLQARGYKVHYYDVGVDALWTLDPIRTELVIVLGGPIGANDGELYPHLADLTTLLERRLAADRPTLGICLGAQLMAKTLGARVRPAPRPAIGLEPLEVTPAGAAAGLAGFTTGPALRWHGEVFDLPPGCERLAATPDCETQAFARGRNVIGFQFHPEAGGGGFERWLLGHTGDLRRAGVDIGRLRAAYAAAAPGLQARARACLETWLDGIVP